MGQILHYDAPTSTLSFTELYSHSYEDDDIKVTGGTMYSYTFLFKKNGYAYYNNTWNAVTANQTTSITLDGGTFLAFSELEKP